jgi:hypothetical protein
MTLPPFLIQLEWSLVVGDALVGGGGGVAGGGHPAEPLVRAFRFRYILNCCPSDVARCGTYWQPRVRKEMSAELSQ